MEGIHEQQHLSDEQLDKVAKLLPIVNKKFDSFTNSDDAYETADSMNRLYDYLKEQELNPKEYFLWSLLAPGEPEEGVTYPYFDTPDGDIETFIRALSHAGIEE